MADEKVQKLRKVEWDFNALFKKHKELTLKLCAVYAKRERLRDEVNEEHENSNRRHIAHGLKG